MTVQYRVEKRRPVISIRSEIPEITTSIVKQSFSSAKFAERNQEDLEGVNTNPIQVQLGICRFAHA